MRCGYRQLDDDYTDLFGYRQCAETKAQASSMGSSYQPSCMAEFVTVIEKANVDGIRKQLVVRSNGTLLGMTLAAWQRMCSLAIGRGSIEQFIY